MHVRRQLRGSSGWTLVEALVVVAVVSTLAAVTIGVTPYVVTGSKASGASGRVVATLRFAREQAISQRRDVHVVFTAPNRIQVFREEFPGGALTQLSDVTLEDQMEFTRFATQPQAPDTDPPNGAAVDFGLATALQFTSEGAFVDQADDILNGVVYLGIPNQEDSARAVTIFGPTALIREFRWLGAPAQPWLEQ